MFRKPHPSVGSRLVSLAALVLVHARTVRAADPAPAPEAKDVFQGALSAFDAHDYTKALGLFQRSYDLSRKPEILFDIAETYVVLGDCRQALDELDRVEHADVSPALLARAKARRRELEPCSPASPGAVSVIGPESRGAVPSLRPDAVPAPIAAPPEPPSVVWRPASASVHSGVAWKTASLTALGAGAACVLAGLVFELEAHSAQQSVESANAWDPGAMREDERGRTFDTAGTALLIAGGVAAVASVVTYVVARRFR